MRIYRKPATAGNSPLMETNKGVSMTQPDMALTVREIMERYASGTLPDLTVQPNFTDELPDLRGMDISEKHQYMEANRERIKELNAQLKKPKKVKEEEKPIEHGTNSSSSPGTGDQYSR